MKKLGIIITFVFIAMLFIGCKKEVGGFTEYELTFEAHHHYTNDDIDYSFEEGYVYYSFSVDDIHMNNKFEKTGYITDGDIQYSTKRVKSGDWLFIYVLVGNVYDYGSVKCTSSDGTINLYLSTDNLYINESDGVYLKSVMINNREFKELKYFVK